MLTGLPPFYCQDRERLFEKIRKETLRFPPSLSSPSKTVLGGLLERDPDKRLGSGPTDAEEIKSHNFFSVIEWEKLQGGEIKPPWKPPVKGNADTSQFDTEFTTMPIFSPQSHQVRNMNRTCCLPCHGSTRLTFKMFARFTAPTWYDSCWWQQSL